MAAKRQDANGAAPPRVLGASRLLAAGLLLTFGAGLVAMVVAIAAEIREPVDLRPIPYARSGSCQPCHPDHYDSWHRTFHRTMTQIASSASVLGDFDGASYTYQGVTSRFTREGERYFIETLATDGRPRRFEIALTVGSRRVQQYVAAVGDRHIRLPLAWNIEEGRWFHLNGGFLHPDGSDFNTHAAVWDANCIFCHNVKANPGFDFSTQKFRSGVAELGIACEACHGPGEEHVRRNENPLRRYLLHSSLTPRDPTIHSPLELSKERQVQLCGHCHGQRVPNPLERIDEFATRGDPYTAGDDLSEYTTPVQIDTKLEGADFSLRFWKDGTPRLTAYEYQGLLQSKDYQHGDLTCISCHSMHGGDPKGMITEEKRGPAACLPCHAEIGKDIEGHTKHKAASAGSDCYACHMPKITYGLLDVHPTHRIQNPDPSRAWRYDMPEACTLCHTDKTARWAAASVSAQYGTPPPSDAPDDPAFAVAECVRALLGGDVVQRAVAVMALSGEASYTADPLARLWAAPFLLIAMEDRYPAVRHFAFRGLRALAGRAARADEAIARSLEVLPPFDPLGTEPERRAALSRWSAWWAALDKAKVPHPGEAVPLDERLQPIPERVAALARPQDEKIIAIGE